MKGKNIKFATMLFVILTLSRCGTPSGRHPLDGHKAGTCQAFSMCALATDGSSYCLPGAGSPAMGQTVPGCWLSGGCQVCYPFAEEIAAQPLPAGTCVAVRWYSAETPGCWFDWPWGTHDCYRSCHNNGNCYTNYPDFYMIPAPPFGPCPPY